jgi:DNA-binding LytR/AlgR family response regulator
MLMRLRTIIVDDEPMARKGLEEDLREIGFIVIAGIAENSFQAIEMVIALQPDLLLLDIEMPRLNGLDLIKSLKNPPLIIIITAYSGYALEGYELDVVDYLMKPVDFPRLLKACCKAREFLELKKLATRPTPFSLPADGYFFVKCNGKHEKINFNELLFVEAADNYVIIHTATKNFMTHDTLRNMESLLPELHFIKVHKSFIVALDRIDHVQGNEIVLGSTKIPVSRNHRDSLIERLVKKNRPDKTDT